MASNNCCIKNCYGNTLEDLDMALKDNLPSILINFLLNLGRCSNNQARKNGLSNWNTLNLFAYKDLRNDYRDSSNNGGRFDIDNAVNIPDNRLDKVLDDFNKLICNGGSKDLDDLDNNYNGGGNGSNGGRPRPIWPPLTDDEKNTIKDDLLDNNNHNDSKDNPNDNDNGIMVDPNNPVTPDGDGNNWDDEFGKPGNPIINVPDDEFNDLDYSKKYFKCFEPEFKLDNYLFDDKKSPPIITPVKVKNIRKIHFELLLPIYNFYYGETSNPSCQIKVSFCLGSLRNVKQVASGSVFSRHSNGEAVDFTMVGISTSRLIEDLKSGALNVRFGALVPTNGVHLTLPYEFENKMIERMVLTSPKNFNQSLRVEFI